MKSILGLFLMLMWAALMGVISWGVVAVYVAVPIGVFLLRLKLSPAYRDQCKEKLAARGWF